MATDIAYTPCTDGSTRGSRAGGGLGVSGSPGRPGVLVPQIRMWHVSLFGDRRVRTNTRGFNKPYGIALELVYRAENRCKSSGAPAGAFPKPLKAG